MENSDQFSTILVIFRLAHGWLVMWFSNQQLELLFQGYFSIPRVSNIQEAQNVYSHGAQYAGNSN